MTDIPLLTPDEAARVRAAVYAHRDLWRARHPVYPFFTLGAASYLDARNVGFKAYQEQAQVTNLVLLHQFGWLLERLRQTVASYVGGEASFEPRLALPGFHIYLFDPSFRRSSVSGHFDLQYELIDWTEIGAPEVASQISLTLSISLPAGGAGLLVWNIDRRELDNMTREQRIEYSRANRTATRKPYTVGYLAVHSGHQLHQIASAPDLEPNDGRITLQAHSLPVNGRWIIYW